MKTEAFQESRDGGHGGHCPHFEETHTCEERGETSIGWVRGVYPTEKTAQDAIQRDDLFVLEEKGSILGCAIINQLQVDVYAGAPWRQEAKDEDVMVLHTLVIAPDKRGRGLGPAFVNFYEQYAREQGCPFLRMDTNARNIKARPCIGNWAMKKSAWCPAGSTALKGCSWCCWKNIWDNIGLCCCTAFYY